MEKVLVEKYQVKCRWLDLDGKEWG